MILKVQIITLITSFLYGIFFGITLDLNYKIIYKTSKFYGVVIHVVFVLFHILTYFFLLQKVNNGIFHPYALLVLILGVLVEHLLFTNIKNYLKPILARHSKRWYNFPRMENDHE